MQVLLPTILAEFDLIGSALGVAVSVVVSFVVITLVASYYRFQNIIDMAEEKNPEEMGATASEILRVQLARYLAGCARRGTSFSMSLIRPGAPGLPVRMDSPVVEAIKDAVRIDDIVCVFDDQTAVLLTEAEPEDAESMLTRIVKSVASSCSGVHADEVRVGIASYPGHGLSGKELIAVAQQGLAETTVERPIILPEIVDVEDEEEIDTDESSPAEPTIEEDAVDEEEESREHKGRKARRKDAILDPVTGVLKPSMISTYMQRMMSDLRYKKQKAALFCVGVNNMEHIARFHGDDAADDVMAGVSRVLQDHLRASDLIGRHEKYAFLVLAKCSLEEAEGIGKRVSTLVQQAGFESDRKKLKTTITLGVAAYPDHGRNLHHLYTAGQKVLDYSRANDIRAYAIYDPEIHDKVQFKRMKSIKSIQA